MINSLTVRGLRGSVRGRRTFALVLVYLLGQVPVFAQATDSLARVQSALAKLDATDLDEDWYFTMDVVEKKSEGEEVRVIASNPTRALYERRQLVSVNGEPPDTERLEAFREEEKKRIDDIDPDTKGYRYLVESDTLRLEDKDDAHARYLFTPRVKDMEKSREYLRGTLLFNLATGQIDRLEIENTEQLKPVFSVTVDTYRLVLGFGEEQSERLVKTLATQAVGKAGFLKGFDTEVTIAFHDFRRATD